MSRYDTVYAESMARPADFWSRAAMEISWMRQWDRVLDESRAPMYRWFAGARLNVCANALDRHVDAGHGARTALIYDSPVTGTVRSFTYAELRDRVARFAGALRGLGVGYGHRVIIYMPMVPEAVVAMLACARLGAVHSVVFGGFAAAELASRIDDAQPKVIISASNGIEPRPGGGAARVISYKPLLDAAIAQARHKPDACVILQRPPHDVELVAGRDHDFAQLELLAEAVAPISVEATDPLYILYTSGTTGIPKGVVHDSGGYAVALAWSMRHIYGVEPGDVFWAASDLGWAVGHSYIVYGPLIHGCTTVLYEGKPVGTPDAGAFWRVIAQHGVNVLFTAPTAFRAIKREDFEGTLRRKYDLSRFRALFLAGERGDPPTIQWAEQQLGVPVIDHWWQTETGWPVAANCLGLGQLPVKHGSTTKAVPGWDVRVVAADGTELPPGDIGALVITLPLPPGALPTLWQKDDHFREAYLTEYPGTYHTSDAGYIDDQGYIYVMSRTDDIINVAGHRLSTGEMEQVLAAHGEVAECAVVGIADELKGQVPLGLVVLKAGCARAHAEIVRELVELVRQRIGPVACFKRAVVVQRLPKTRSGKILRATMRAIADRQSYRMPATIDDPAILDEITAALRG
jgi:propionyl-CoA synthetase